MIRLLPWVAAGGALGALARHGIDVAAPAGVGFPWATLGINVFGAALLAMVPLWSWLRRQPWGPAFAGTGVLGGFTTMSTFSEQTRALLAAGRVGLAATYVAATIGLGLLAVWCATAYVDARVGAAARAEFEAEEGDE